MTIVLNEHEWAEDMINSHSLGDKPYETFCRVAKYYLDKDYSKKEVRKMLDNFLIQCEPTASVPKWSETLDFAVKRASKYEAIKIDSIDITKPEMEIIDSLEGRQIKRLAFTLLCLAKYWDVVNPQGDHWVNSKDNEIMRMANINTSIKRQSMMYHTLKQQGLIKFSKKVDNTNVRVCFIKDGEVAMSISDFRNLGYQYLKYHGENYFECANCGVTVKPKDKVGAGRPQKYCPACALEIHMQQKINSMMRNRSKEDNKEYTVYMHKFPDGKMYIGMTGQTLATRWKNGLGYKGSPVGSAIEKCGWDNVQHYILFKGLDKDSARLVESYVIKTKHTYLPEYGYNTNNTTYSKINDDICPEYLNIEVDNKGVAIVN